ncbi:hypothetical protein A8C56_13700 [Niabella ginsenosidivorans]|uniref:Glycosyl transferase n=1 Tax=Niabella ginsenosidivorans TaxID=1176587 RepID=A0A1A9I2K0_9BACT|nr:glycosyltransferase family 9 protein [Niabella ginsenosidivorans]ANH81887.1 hypothetical protein A8C56_13700 [Niabella ginsenosidivorans]
MMAPELIRKILCIRLDNMGDVLMSAPAIRALKETYGAAITLLTSRQGGAIASFIPEIDEVLLSDVPWVQHSGDEDALTGLAQQLRAGCFDLAVIFTVSSQNPLPSAMLAYMAGIPVRLAYCRENPYRLLTHWVPDPEPLRIMDKHQVERDLDLVASIGAYTRNKRLLLQTGRQYAPGCMKEIAESGVPAGEGCCLLHAGTRDPKRRLPVTKWVAIGRALVQHINKPLLLTGNEEDAEEAAFIQQQIGPRCFNIAGRLTLGAFITLVSNSSLLISINSLPLHIAAAVQTPVIALYAKTNPQHLPWMVAAAVLFFDVPDNLRSSNELLQFMHRHYQWNGAPVSAENVVAAAQRLLDAEKSRSASATTAE